MSKIEEIFRNSLKDIEAPYDPKAWEAISKRLDKQLPVKSVKTSFKWAWVASSILIVGVAAFFALQKNETSKKTAKKLYIYPSISKPRCYSKIKFLQR